MSTAPHLSDSYVPPDLSIDVERDDDLLLLRYDFYGFIVDTVSTPPAILPVDGLDNQIVVTFPPQAMGEAVYPFSSDDPVQVVPYDPDNDVTLGQVDPPPLAFDLNPVSKLVFRAPGPIPLPSMTPADLLDFSAWQLIVPEAATFDYRDQKLPTPPALDGSDRVTQVAAPYLLVLAPVEASNTPSSPGQAVSSFTGRPEPLTVPSQVQPGVAYTDCWEASLDTEQGALAAVKVLPAEGWWTNIWYASIQVIH